MEVKIIKADTKYDGTSKVNCKDKIRVAAYCRVSTDDEEQEKSYDSMVKHYTDYIKENKNWIFAGVYSDKGITGTKTENRVGFQKLIRDSMEGKIDLILAKSLSRFARNTLDTLKYVRMLREKNVAVLFEVEKINTMKDGEFLMTILSSVAQQEVENTSAYVKKGLRMKMKRGELVGFQHCLGFDYDKETKTISINQEGAEIVRYIFQRYVEGAGCSIIARELNEMNLKTLKGNNWLCGGVREIIKNEKYVGDLLQGKTFTVDPISKRRLENFGEEDKYYVKDHHEAIVSREVFEAAQAIRKKRGTVRKPNPGGIREKFSRQYSFSCMLECGFCGSHLSRRNWHGGTEYFKRIWHCVASTKKGKRFCPESKGVPEEVIEKAFVESYNRLCEPGNDVLDSFLKNVSNALCSDAVEQKLKKLYDKENNIKRIRKKLLDEFLNGNIEKEIYKITDYNYNKEEQIIKEQISSEEAIINKEDDIKKKISKFREILSKQVELKEFDREIFECLVEKVIVGERDEDKIDPYKIIFVYKTGFKDEIKNSKDKYYTDRRRKSVQAAVTGTSALYSDGVDNACGNGSITVPPMN